MHDGMRWGVTTGVCLAQRGVALLGQSARLAEGNQGPEGTALAPCARMGRQHARPCALHPPQAHPRAARDQDCHSGAAHNPRAEAVLQKAAAIRSRMAVVARILIFLQCTRWGEVGREMELRRHIMSPQERVDGQASRQIAGARVCRE